METPKIAPVSPPPSPHPAQTAEALQQEGVDRQRAVADQLGAALDTLAQTEQILAEAKRILKDLVAAGVLTDGFMTAAVGQSLLNQAAAAEKFLKEHP